MVDYTFRTLPKVKQSLLACTWVVTANVAMYAFS